jgi:hypothetical protein
MEEVTREQLEGLMKQQVDAEQSLAARWDMMSKRVDDMSRIMAGEMTEEDVELFLLCVETCLGQCVVYWTAEQLQTVKDHLDKAGTTLALPSGGDDQRNARMHPPE